MNPYLPMLPRMGWRNLATAAGHNLLSVNHYYALNARISTLEARPYRGPDLNILKTGEPDMKELAGSLQGLDDESRKEMVIRLMYYGEGFHDCYVARTPDHEPAGILWIVFPSSNHLLAKHYRRRFAPLRADQVMVENGFCFPRYRGLGLLPRLTRHLLLEARNAGYEYSVAYAPVHKVVSLNEFLRLGFTITRMFTEYRVFGRALRTV